ncbi:DnaA ATPase domain-containing protein [Amycolatopsis magusensis]|uniref:DnaA ATPase domain-containing protein n=1 Tax=Amycolatopsis magusensis TaxID=882444 RepID=UPI003C2CECF8
MSPDIRQAQIARYRELHPEAADKPDEEVLQLLAEFQRRTRQQREAEQEGQQREIVVERNARFLARRPRKYRQAMADHPDVVAWVEGYVAALPPTSFLRITERPHFNSLFLYGTAGTGKTWQALGIPALLAEKNVPADYSYIRAVDYLDRQQNSTFETKEALFEEARDARLLILDDLLAGGDHKRSVSDLYRLLDARFIDERPTIMTCNVSGPDLVKALGERIVDRLREDAKSVKMVGDSRRKFRPIAS